LRPRNQPGNGQRRRPGDRPQTAPAKRAERRPQAAPEKRPGGGPQAVPAKRAERRTGTPMARPARERGAGWIYGRHAVAAALANPQRRWRRLAVIAGHAAEAAALVAAARAERRGAKGPEQEGAAEPVEVLDPGALDLLLPEGAVHQGWALQVEPLDPADLDDVLRAAEVSSGRAVIVMLDQVSDPHNVGAVLRSAAAFGAAAVVVAEHGAPPATATLAKTASGALDLVPLVRVVNLARALDRLKEAGFWSCGLDEGAPEKLSSLDLGARVVLVLGSEGGGLRRLVRERCDYLARLPTRPALPSLNVSNAAAVALYELARDPGPG
jgi:23S rRNA (guanosine2251-2'-O)-methyltransferase